MVAIQALFETDLGALYRREPRGGKASTIADSWQLDCRLALKLLNFESDRWCRRLCLYKSVQQSIIINRKTINVCQSHIHISKVVTYFLHVQGDIHRTSKLARP